MSDMEEFVAAVLNGDRNATQFVHEHGLNIGNFIRTSTANHKRTAKNSIKPEDKSGTKQEESEG